MSGNDLPTADNTNGATEDKNPLLATLEAMQRLKATNEEHEKRIKNLEDAFELAFKNGAKSLEAFLTKMDENDGSSDKASEGASEEEEDEPPASVGDEKEETQEASSDED